MLIPGFYVLFCAISLLGFSISQLVGTETGAVVLMSYVTGQVLDVCRPHTANAAVTAIIHCATTKTVLSFDSAGTIAVTHEVQCQFKPLRTRRIRAGDSSDGIVFAAYSHRLGLIATATADTVVTVWGFEYLEVSACS
jgi:hypothetical protein